MRRKSGVEWKREEEKKVCSGRRKVWGGRRMKEGMEQKEEMVGSIGGGG